MRSRAAAAFTTTALVLVACSSRSHHETQAPPEHAVESTSMPAAPSAPAPSLLSHDTGATGPSVGRVVRGAEYRGIVLDRGAFVLTDADVARIERVLSAGITSDARITRAPSEYTRQYVAYRDGGARRVSIALHCEAPPDWQTQGLPEVLGGGNCYLRATYDLDSDRVLSISVSSGR